MSAGTAMHPFVCVCVCARARVCVCAGWVGSLSDCLCQVTVSRFGAHTHARTHTVDQTAVAINGSAARQYKSTPTLGQR